MNQKRIIEISLLAIIIVWLSCFSCVICVSMVRNNQAAQTQQTTTETSATVQTTTAPQTTHTTTEKLIVGGNIVATTVIVDDPQWLVEQEASIQASKLADEISKSLTTTEPTTAKNGYPVPKTKDEIIDAYISGVNEVKNTKDFTLYKDDSLNLIFDSITGGSLVQSFAQSLAEDNQKVPITYNFADGLDSATGNTPLSAIAPLNSYASINHDAVKTATAVPNSDGGYTLNLVIQDEVQTHNTAAPNLATTVEVIDVSPLLPAGATLSDLTINYTGTTITATFNNKGKLTYMEHYLCVDKAKGTGGYGPLSITMEMHGDFTSKYTFTY